MPRRRLYLRDAVGRLRPKYGSARRYTQRAAVERYEHEYDRRKTNAYRNARVIVYDRKRVNIPQFAESPNRKPGSLSGIKTKPHAKTRRRRRR